MEVTTSNNPSVMKSAPPLQRGISMKRAILIPQVTNLKFEHNDLEALANGAGHPATSDLKPKRSSHRLKSLNHLKTDRSTSQLPAPTTALPASQQNSNNSIKTDKTDENEFIDRFMENVPAVGLAKEDSKLKRTRVIEEMYRIQERSQITPEERQRLFQLAVSMDAPKLARKLVSEAKDLMISQNQRQGVGAFLTGEVMMDHSPSRRSESKPPLKSSSSGNSNNSSNQIEDLEFDEDELFCKAFDEVERIRKRILQRASNNPTSPSSKASQIPEDDHPEAKDDGFENITLQKKTSFHQEKARSTPGPSLSPKRNTSSTNNNQKIYPTNAPPLLTLPPKSTTKSPRVSNESSSSAINRTRSHSNSSAHPPHISSSVNHSLDDADLQITHAIDSLIGSGLNSRQNSHRGGFNTPPEDGKHGPPSSDESTSQTGFSFYDPFYKADRRTFQQQQKQQQRQRKNSHPPRMNSSLLRSAEHELKMVKEKLAKFDDVTASTTSLQNDNNEDENQSHLHHQASPARRNSILSTDSSNVSKYFVSNQSQSTLKSEEDRDKHWKSTTMQEEGETDVNNDDDDDDHNFFLAEPKPTSHSTMSQKEMLSPLPPVRTISNKPIPSNQPRIAPSTTDNPSSVSSKFQARMLVASPLSDWLQLGLNLDLPNPTPSSARQVDTGDLPSTASTIRDPSRFSRQSSGFLLEPIGSKGGVAGGEPQSHPLNHNHHPRGVHTTSHLHHGNQKFFESSLPTRDKEGVHIMSSMELLKQFPNSDALHKAKKSLLILNEQIQQLHSPKSSHAQNHFHPNHATSPHQMNPESSPSDSPLHNIPLGPKISATSSYSAPPSTRNSHPGPFISTKTTTDELSALLESHDSLDEHQSHYHPTTSTNGVLRKSSFSSKKDFVSASVDEAMLIGKTDSTSSVSPQSARLGGVSTKGAGAYLVSQSLNEADHQRSTPRQAMGGAGGRLFEYTNDGKGSNISQSQRSLAVNGAVAHPSPRMIGSTSVSRLKAGGLSLMRDNSNRSLVVEDVVSTKNAKKAPYDFQTPAVTPSAATSTGSEKARVAALAAALDAGDAVGKLMAEMFSTSKKNK